METEIKNAIIELEKKDVRFAFLHENVREQLLEDQIKQDYAYKRMELISQLVKTITAVQEKVEFLGKRRNEEKYNLLNFVMTTLLI
ncbi:hypothetical protein [Heyndrickxia ginsengihumi]|uniref:hypothetical protein n=1 Tax=Heyndrickxia ginsengihumi TaxID=363870 RepID=UPI00068EEF1F|nr:hypothetical protein [Heyndrickxia ginsengihumi]